MLIYLLEKLFLILIGKLPKEKKDELLSRGRQLLLDAIEAGAEGMVKGAIKK